MSDFQLRHICMIMAPQVDNPLEAEGVLNPASARGLDGQLHLFPRMVAHGNFSRVGIARVRFNAAGDPEGVERLRIALEPDEAYEHRPGGGGCEDPRIAFVEPLRRYVMTYTALSPSGPRIALAISKDLFHWRRLGLATFRPYNGIEFAGVDNKEPACSRLSCRTRAGSCLWRSFSTHRFPALVLKRWPINQAAVSSISTTKVSGFPTARQPRRGARHSIYVISARTIGWRHRSRHGSG